jgi:hypothetical protein
MNPRADSTRVVHPLFQMEDGGSIPTSALTAASLRFDICPKPIAVALVRQWHSRLPNCQSGPWTHAHCASHGDTIYAVALWNSPSGRCLPGHWRELRRMACAPDAPRNTASRFLGWMVRWFRTHHPEAEKLISYQDTAVHAGTIYKAAGWVAEYASRPRTRNRTGMRVGTERAYRSNMNGSEPDGSGKIRWSVTLSGSLPMMRKHG